MNLDEMFNARKNKVAEVWDDEAGYDTEDPKHPDYAERMADLGDYLRKRQREEPPESNHGSTPIKEKWSEKYKRSIDCNNPQGFSQRAHCAGRKKQDESVDEAYEKTAALQGKLSNLNTVIQKQQQLDKLVKQVERAGIMNPGLQADADTLLYVRRGEQDNYEALTHALDTAIQRFQARLATRRASGLREQGVAEEKCPHCGGPMFEFSQINEKQDACYYKVKSRYKVWPSAYASGALVQCRKKGAKNWGTKSESAIAQGIDQIDENLRNWFKEKWVRFGPDGKIRGDCARGDDSEGKPKCLPQSKAHSLGKKGRASAASRKRREDPNPERSGRAINVATKKKTSEGMGDTKTDILGTYKGYKFAIETQTEDDRYVKFYSAIGPDGKEHSLPKGTTVEQFKKFVDSKQGMAEGEVVPFRRPQPLTWQQLPPDVLKLANDWYWASEEDTGLDAVMDPKGYGSGTKNDLRYITAQLAQRGWTIDYNDEHDRPGEFNLVLANKKGQKILLSIEDAQDFKGWAQGTKDDVREQGVVEEQLDELKCWPGHHRVPGTKEGEPGSCAKNEGVAEAYNPWDEGDMWYRLDDVSGTLKQRIWRHAQERDARAAGWSQTQEQALRRAGIIRSKFNPKKFVQKQGTQWVEVFPYGRKDVEETAEKPRGHRVVRSGPNETAVKK